MPISSDAGETSADIQPPPVNLETIQASNIQQQEITPIEPVELTNLQKDGTGAEEQESPVPYYQEASNKYLDGWRLYILTFG